MVEANASTTESGLRNILSQNGYSVNVQNAFSELGLLGDEKAPLLSTLVDSLSGALAQKYTFSKCTHKL